MIKMVILFAAALLSVSLMIYDSNQVLMFLEPKSPAFVLVGGLAMFFSVPGSRKSINRAIRGIQIRMHTLWSDRDIDRLYCDRGRHGRSKSTWSRPRCRFTDAHLGRLSQLHRQVNDHQ